MSGSIDRQTPPASRAASSRRPLADTPIAPPDRSPPLPDELVAYEPLLRQLRAGAALDDKASLLADAAARVWIRPGFDTFISLPRLHFEPFAHQISAAEAVLRRMHGRAILADEVGLGKTIEACLVLNELRLRRLAQDVLILTPAGLVSQWAEELERKFGLMPHLAAAGWQRGAGSPDGTIVLASLPSARRGPLRDAMVGKPWDAIIVDEAHRLKNPQSVSARLLKALRSRYLLLLTATPVENRIDDLFHLISLVRPGYLGTITQFRAQHGRGAAATPRDLPGLRARMRDIMVRHRRSEVALMLPRRLAETVRVVPGTDEAELYAAVSQRVRDEARKAPANRMLSLHNVQRLAGSTPSAVAPTLERMQWHDLAALAGGITSTGKSAALIERLRHHLARGEKTIVFTAFRQTVEFLDRCAAAEGLPAIAYHGGLSRREKDEAIRRFSDDLPILMTTEAAGEGRNLQFSHVMINFDLPWNPMQIEQRLGRIHRIGQTHDVLLTNLVSRGTIEDRILHVLEAKLNVFELVVGELDMILGRVGDDLDFESFVFAAHVESNSDDEFRARLDGLGDSLAGARSDYRDSRERVDSLVGDETEAS